MCVDKVRLRSAQLSWAWLTAKPLATTFSAATCCRPGTLAESRMRTATLENERELSPQPSVTRNLLGRTCDDQPQLSELKYHFVE